MHEQLCLLDLPKPPPRTDHLFLGILPDVNTAGQISKVASHYRKNHELGNRQLAADRFHVSLYSLGTYSRVPENIVRAASLAAATVAASTPPFKVVFDRVGSFTGSLDNRPLVLRDHGGNPDLMEFHQRLVAELTGFGFRNNPQFTPHLTLLYSHRSVAEESIDPVSWTVNEFVLVHSLIGKSRYRQLACWPLQGQMDDVKMEAGFSGSSPGLVPD